MATKKTPTKKRGGVRKKAASGTPSPAATTLLADATALAADLRVLGFGEPSGNTTTFTSPNGYSIVVTLNPADSQQSTINYGPDIQVHHRVTRTFRQSETLVVLGCVVTLLKKGYDPALIELEKTWTLGHGGLGRLDVLVRDPSRATFAMVECKTAGSQYAKERNNTLEDGGQLLSYYQQDQNAKALYLYSSRIDSGQLTELAEFIRTDGLTGSNVEELHTSWGGTLEPSGLFHSAAGLYDDKFRGITKSQLQDLNSETGEGVFHSFAEVLRRHVVSDKPNAFNKIFNLFLCKITDEDEKTGDQEMDFQWRFGDSGEALLERLVRLYRRGLSEYLQVETEAEYHSPLGEFAFIDVFDKATFDHNAMILREVVELLQHYRIKYSARHQYLGDFFEMLLSTGIKQEAGQFFTPIPLARAVIRSLPIGSIIETKVAARKTDILPLVVDFSCGAGHFLTEAIEEIHEVSDAVETSRLTGRARTRFERGRAAYGWVSDFIVGIEKDQRLAKVTKIATFLNGDGDANIVHADGLAPFDSASGYPPQLVSRDQGRLGKVDIVIANPPFSVPNFRRDVADGASRFRLYEHLSANSGEIECLFLERASQLLVDGGTAGIFFPLSLLNNGRAIYRAARRLLAIDFEVCGLIELRGKTFIATPTTTVCCFLKRRTKEEVEQATNALLRLTAARRAAIEQGGVDAEAIRAEVAALASRTGRSILDAAYQSDNLAHAIRLLADKSVETIVAFTGDSVQEQQRALGYRYSKSRGSEGYTVFKENGIPQTLLYDPESLTNQGRFSGAVLARMEGRPLEIPADDDEVAGFMVSIPSSDIWTMPGGLIKNPSAFFVSELTVESGSPHGDFIDDLACDDQTIGEWLNSGRCKLVRGVVYPKEAETPRVTATRVLTASNLNLNTRRITEQQFRYLVDNSLVSPAQRPVEGDIVICTASGSLKHLGKIAVIEADVDAYIGGFLNLFRCPNATDRKILEYNLLSARFRQMVARAKEQNINNLTEEKLRSFMLRVPTERDRFAHEVSARESR